MNEDQYRPPPGAAPGPPQAPTELISPFVGPETYPQPPPSPNTDTLMYPPQWAEVNPPQDPHRKRIVMAMGRLASGVQDKYLLSQAKLTNGALSLRESLFGSKRSTIRTAAATAAGLAIGLSAEKYVGHGSLHAITAAAGHKTTDPNTHTVLTDVVKSSNNRLPLHRRTHESALTKSVSHNRVHRFDALQAHGKHRREIQATRESVFTDPPRRYTPRYLERYGLGGLITAGVGLGLAVVGYRAVKRHDDRGHNRVHHELQHSSENAEEVLAEDLGMVRLLDPKPNPSGLGITPSERTIRLLNGVTLDDEIAAFDHRRPGRTDSSVSAIVNYLNALGVKGEKSMRRHLIAIGALGEMGTIYDVNNVRMSRETPPRIRFEQSALQTPEEFRGIAINAARRLRELYGGIPNEMFYNSNIDVFNSLMRLAVPMMLQTSGAATYAKPGVATPYDLTRPGVLTRYQTSRPRDPFLHGQVRRELSFLLDILGDICQRNGGQPGDFIPALNLPHGVRYDTATRDFEFDPAHPEVVEAVADRLVRIRDRVLFPKP